MSQDKYKFNFNKEELSEERIKKHQNFDKLMRDFNAQKNDVKSDKPKRTPTHKSRRIRYTLLAAASLIFLVGLSGYFLIMTGDAQKSMAYENVSTSSQKKSQSRAYKPSAKEAAKPTKNENRYLERAAAPQGTPGPKGMQAPQANPGPNGKNKAGALEDRMVVTESKADFDKNVSGVVGNNGSLDVKARDMVSPATAPPPPPPSIEVVEDELFYEEEIYEVAKVEIEEVIEEEMDYTPVISKRAKRAKRSNKYSNTNANTNANTTLEMPDLANLEITVDEEPSMEIEEIHGDIEESEEAEMFTIVEEMPEFPGGQKAMFEFLNKELNYPTMAKENSIEGRAIVSFIVKADGSISDIELLRDIGGGCGQESIRVVSEMPKWKPGKQRGKAVDVKYNLPIRFALDGSTTPLPKSKTKIKSKDKPDTQNKYVRPKIKVEENDFLAVNDRPLSTFSIDVDKASYSLVRQSINNNNIPYPNSVRIEELINYFNYEYEHPEPNSKDPLNIYTELTNCPWQPEHRLALVGLQGKSVPAEELPENNLVFLLDVSGSMSAQNKLPLVKQSIKLLTDKMRPEDRVSIVVYAGAAGEVLPSTPIREKETILKALSTLNAGGSTAGGEGIDLAYKIALKNFMPEGNNRIILCTDGDFNVGPSSDAALVKLIEEKRKSGVFLTILGFGSGNYQDKKMEKLSNAGNGNNAFIDNGLEAKKVLDAEMYGTLYTIAKDVKLQVEFNPDQVRSYRLIGYTNRKMKDEDFANDMKDAGELGVNHQVTALYEIVPVNSKSLIGKNANASDYQGNYGDGLYDNELLNVKLRYKLPDSDRSTRMEQALIDQDSEAAYASENLRFASAVAAYGMLLQDSKYKGATDYNMVLQLAKSAKGADKEGYRSEFIKIVEKTQYLDGGFVRE